MPLLAGLGLALALLATLCGMLDLDVLMWAGQDLFHLFSSQRVGEGFLDRDILDMGDSSLEELGGLRNQVLLVLSIATLSTFVFIMPSTRSVEKVSMVPGPTAFMLIMTLTIRKTTWPAAALKGACSSSRRIGRCCSRTPPG